MQNKIVDLEAVMISPRAVAQWGQVAREAVKTLQAQGKLGRWQNVPDEQAQVNADETLTIFVEVAGQRIEMIVPQGEWQWNN